MTQHTIVQLVDDLNGEDAAETVVFGLDGQSYEIDLTELNAKELREGLAAFVHNGRKVRVQTAGRRSTPAPRPELDLADVRAWARAQGEEISERGRVAATILAKYREAHGL